jgi:hypothetical protein
VNEYVIPVNKNSKLKYKDMEIKLRDELLANVNSFINLEIWKHILDKGV